MNNHDKAIILMQIPIFIIGIIFIALGIKQEFYWLKLFDYTFGTFNMIFSTTITVCNVRDVLRGKYYG